MFPRMLIDGRPTTMIKVHEGYFLNPNENTKERLLDEIITKKPDGIEKDLTLMWIEMLHGKNIDRIIEKIETQK